MEGRQIRNLAVSGCLLALAACGGTRPAGVGGAGTALAPCPASPNCVSSEASDAGHRVEPFELSAAPESAWTAVVEDVARLPRTTVVQQTGSTLHAECASALFGFVDDLELRREDSEPRIAVRSASRVGRSDLGANRRRVEGLRAALRARGVVR